MPCKIAFCFWIRRRRKKTSSSMPCKQRRMQLDQLLSSREIWGTISILYPKVQWDLSRMAKMWDPAQEVLHSANLPCCMMHLERRLVLLKQKFRCTRLIKRRFVSSWRANKRSKIRIIENFFAESTSSKTWMRQL